MVQELMEGFLRGETKPLEAGNEAAWYQLWNGKNLGKLSPRASALQGGLLADRLPWVFVAAYQAAIRSVFQEVPRQGWAAFVATEDKKDPDARPGTSLCEAGSVIRLSGYKSWVAQSRSPRAMVGSGLIGVSSEGTSTQSGRYHNKAQSITQIASAYKAR